jgi:hypothetical protein
MIGRCVCSLRFEFCAFCDAALCYRMSLFPATDAGREAARKVGGRVMPDENEYLAKVREIRELARGKEKAA